MRDLPHLSSRLFGTPLLVDARKLDAIVPAFMRRLNGDDDDTGDSAPARQLEPALANSIAVIPIIGTLIRRKSMMDAWSGLTSYSDIAGAMQCALDDARVKAILLQLDTMGGEATGCFELCDQLYKARGQKPMWAVADVDALSAGYAILSQAERVFVAPSGSAGSIGAVAVHCERSQMNESMGITYTVIRAGLRKAELNSYEPLTRAAAEKVQESLDKVRTKFISTVVRARKGLTAKAVGATEAQWYDADDALKLKLVDGISTFDDVFAELASTVVVSSIATPPAPAPQPAPVEPPDGDDEDEQQPDPEAPEEEVMDENTPKPPAGATAQPPAPPKPPTPPAPPAAAAAADGNIVSLDSAREQGRETYAAEVREIAELCQLAGKPALAADFIATGKSVADVRKALVDARAKEDKEIGELSNHRPAQAKMGAAAVTDLWDKAFATARGA
jgi:signal peptide peptidase SppA